MANRERGEIGLTVKGKSYTLVLNTGVMASMEEHFSTPDREVTWDQIWMRVLRGSVRTVQALIWSMLKPNHPDFTLEQTGALIDDVGGFAGLTDILKQAGTASTPDPKDVEALGVAKRPRTAQGTRTRRGTGGATSSTRAASA